MRWNMYWHWRKFDREIAAINREIDQIRLHHDEAVIRARTHR
jgi:hypothetical protein